MELFFGLIQWKNEYSKRIGQGNIRILIIVVHHTDDHDDPGVASGACPGNYLWPFLPNSRLSFSKNCSTRWWQWRSWQKWLSPKRRFLGPRGPLRTPLSILRQKSNHLKIIPDHSNEILQWRGSCVLSHSDDKDLSTRKSSCIHRLC